MKYTDNGQPHRSTDVHHLQGGRRLKSGEHAADQAQAPLSTQQFMGHLGRQGQRDSSPLYIPSEESNGATVYETITTRTYDYSPSRHVGSHSQKHPQAHQPQHQPRHNPVSAPNPPTSQSSYIGGYQFPPLGWQQQSHPPASHMSRAKSNLVGSSNHRAFDQKSEEEPLIFSPIVSYGPMEGATQCFELDKTPSFASIYSTQQKASHKLNKPQTERINLHKTVPAFDLAQIHRPEHRRVRSDGMFLRSIHEGLPPFSPSVKGRSQFPAFNNRPRERSHSAHSAKPRHRRGDSASSVASISSVFSERSVVSDIRKSTLYKDVTDAGVIRMHLPADNVQLVMDNALETGSVYKRVTHPDEGERFLAYHLQSQDSFCTNSWQDLMDPNLDDLPGCSCTCEHCIKCNHKAESLPSVHYILVVDCDLYQRVLGEISDSKQMPCGLFFCGHHEDVRKPSICIAVAIVATFFIVLFILTYISGY